MVRGRPGSTIQNLVLVEIDVEQNLLLVRRWCRARAMAR